MKKNPPPTPPAGGRGGKNKRAIARQATSAVAFEHEPPSPGDPILDFTPVPHVRPRRNSITPDLQRAFIAHLAATGIVTSAARHIGRSMEALYKLRQRPGAESFRAAWDAAVDRGVARLEDCALARAIEGEERMVVSQGNLIGTERRHNEGLVMFFLRHRRPERYGPQSAAPSREEIEAELYAELEKRAMAAAREYISRERSQQVGELIVLLEHMVANRLEGRPFIAGIDTKKTIHENAEILRTKISD